MRIGKNYLPISIVVGIIVLAFGSVDSVYATDYVVSDAASCTGLPGGGENWNGTTSTCSKSSNLSVGFGDSLTIPNGVTLELSPNSNLINRESIINNGIITIEGGTGTNSGQLRNLASASFINSGTITIEGGDGTNSGQLRNFGSASFVNSGTITLDGNDENTGRLRNFNTASFTNFGTITITGNADDSGRILNRNTASLINSGIITISGTDDDSGQLHNQGISSITNSGIITITGTNSNSGLIENDSVLTNSGSLTTNYNFENIDSDSVLTNSGTVLITLALDNTGGLITNDCGNIIFGSFTGNPIEEESCQTSFSSTAYEDPTIGKSHNGRQMVENGICIDEQCWTVTAAFHQDFELVEMLSDSTHTITATVFCQHGVHKCNYVAYGVSPYGTNINDSVWKVILQKDHLDNWTMKVVDPDEYLGDVASTTQIVNDNKHLAASATIEFKKPTPGMILNVEVRDSNGGYRDFKFNDGIAIVDSYAYPIVDSSYEAPLDIEPLCLYENPDKRYTCAFEKIREQTLIDAQLVYKDVMNKKY